MKRPVDVSEPRKTERRRDARPNPTASAKRKSRLLTTFFNDYFGVRINR